jgi:hypothetical protein
MPVLNHVVSSRNGCQIMVRGLSLKHQLGYQRHAKVVVSDPADPAKQAWAFIVDNDEHATLCSRNPAPPPWIQPGVIIRISVDPLSGVGPHLAQPSAAQTAQRNSLEAPTEAASVIGTTATEVFAEVTVPFGRETAFDCYLMVDWSGNETPKNGADSIWWCLGSWRMGTLAVDRLENPKTRELAAAEIRHVLVDLVRNSRRVLVGFDFAYGYPAGLAGRLGLPGVPWRAVWEELEALVDDDQQESCVRGPNRRATDRFAVAGAINERIGALPGPFWGHPSGRNYAGLVATKPTYPVGGLSEFRKVDTVARGAHSVWQLLGQGSVGSQVVVGIPHVRRLRDHGILRRRSLVWPFETGCVLPSREQALVVHAEIYPSIFAAPEVVGRPKDSVQVETLVRQFARADADATLGALFEAPSHLATADTRRVVEEEGWILGVIPSFELGPAPPAAPSA